VSPPVTLVFVAWNARAYLARALDAARATGLPVVVVDNASDDGTADHVRANAPDVTLLAMGSNLGFAGGVNAGVQATSTPWALILNPDILLTRAAVDRMQAAGESALDIGAVGAQLVDPDDVPQAEYSIRRFPTLATWAADLLLLDHLWPGNPASARYLGGDLDRTRDQDVEQPAAACLLVRRAAFDAVGGFDAAFHPAWFEDVDFCRRLLAAGWRIRYVAGARVVHEGGVAMRTLGLGSFSTIWYRNLLRYAGKHGTLATRLTLRPLLVAGMALRTALSLLRGRPSDARAYVRVMGMALGAGRQPPRPIP
jgi:N-acetylglucosaminyl-diphospho-decaprenol L-rhamnosyltransferase